MSENVARMHPPVSPTMTTGTVVGGEGGLQVRTDAGVVDAARAKSCLVEAEEGDHVLLVTHAAGAHILAVLDGAEATRVATAGDLTVEADGELRLRGATVGLESEGEATVRANAFALHSEDATLSVRALAYVGKKVLTQVEEVKTVSQSVEQVADRLVQRLERAYRFVAKFEQLRADYLDYAADAAVNIRGGTTVIKSADLTKVDGAQVHVG